MIRAQSLVNKIFTRLCHFPLASRIKLRYSIPVYSLLDIFYALVANTYSHDS